MCIAKRKQNKQCEFQPVDGLFWSQRAILIMFVQRLTRRLKNLQVNASVCEVSKKKVTSNLKMFTDKIKEI